MIPLRITDLKYSKKWPKHIILHHTHELGLTDGSIIYDTPKPQTHILNNTFYKATKVTNLPYHFVVDMVGSDYNVFVCRPMLTVIPYDDIDSVYDNSIHIAVLGDYNSEIGTNRLYSILGYRLICPFIRMFNIPLENVVSHAEISSNPDTTCPGEFMNMNKLQVAIRQFLKKVSVTKG